MNLVSPKLKILHEWEFTEIVKFAQHRRLRYLQSGKCCKCQKEFPRIVEYKVRKGGKHVDLFTQKGDEILTCGHIIPKSLGGPFNEWNIRPLCQLCNSKEGNRIPPELFDYVREQLKSIMVQKDGKIYQIKDLIYTALHDRVILADGSILNTTEIKFIC